MDRRGFLTGLAAGAVGWVAGGKTGLPAADAAQAYAYPVAFSTSAQAATSRSLFVVDAAKTVLSGAATYPQSVASGDPNPNGVVIWTRVAPQAVRRAGSNSLAWQVATTPDFDGNSVVLEGTATVQASVDNTVSLPLQNAILKPFHIYYYRFIFDGVSSKPGRFRTLPRPGDAVQKLKIGYVVCQDYSNGFYNAYGFLAQEQDVDVVVFLGDYIYEYLDDGVGGPNNGPVRVVPPYPLGGQYPQGLPDYRHLWKTYRSDPQIQAAHEQFAFIMLWDDHEFFNDCHQDYHEDTNPPGKSALTPQPALRKAATQAWTEYSLAAVPFNPTLGFEREITVYRNFNFGTLMQLVVTDERLYRDGPPCGDIDIGERYETPGCAAQFDAARTMLGAAQKAWFLDQVTQSTRTWKIWANEVMLAQYKFGPPLTPELLFFDLDQWDGYPDERAEILAAIEAANVQNFVALSGDAHLFMASYLKSDYNDTAAAPMGVELMVGAISSGNYLDAGIDHPAPASTPVAARKLAAAGLPADTLEPLVLAYNPHMVFWNGSTWGYGVLTITPDQLVSVFKTPSTVKTTTSTLSTLATFTVPAGKVQLIPS